MVIDNTIFVVRFILPIVAAVSIFSSVQGQSTDPAWTVDLLKQLDIAEQCEVMYFTTVIETTKGGKKFYSARAHCVDGREFDGERFGENSSFLIKPCEINIC